MGDVSVDRTGEEGNRDGRKSGREKKRPAARQTRSSLTISTICDALLTTVASAGLNVRSVGVG